MAEYELTIRGESARVLSGSIDLSKTATGVNRLNCTVDSIAGAFRAAVLDDAVLTEDSDVIFAGFVDAVDESALSGWGADIRTKVSIADFRSIPTRRYVTATFVSGTLKSVLTSLVSNWFSVYGITLHGSQSDGPFPLPELTYTRVKGHEVLADLATRTKWVWTIDSSKVLRMQSPTSIASPFNMVPNGGHIAGDMMVSERLNDGYANRVLIVVTGAGPATHSETFTSDGTQTAYVSKYPASWDINQPWPNVLVVNGSIVGPVGWGPNQLPPGAWYWDYENHTLVNDTGTPLSNGDTVAVTHGIGYPFVVSVQDDTDVAAKGPWELAIERAEALSLEAAGALGEAELERRMARKRKVTYPTYSRGLAPGQEQLIDEPYRGIDNGTFVINETRSTDVSNDSLRTVVSATEGTFQETYQDIWRQTFGRGSASGGVGSVVSGPTVPTVGATMPAFLGGSLNTSEAPASSTWVDVPESPGFQAQSSVSAVVRVRMKAASGVEVTARLYDVTDSSPVAESDPVASTSPQTKTFVVALVAGHEYVLQMKSDTSAGRIYAIGTVQAL